MGATQLLQCSATPTLTLRSVEGNLSLSGWDRQEIQVRTNADNEGLRIETSEDGFVLVCEGDLWLQAPVQSTVVIAAVEGNASISLLLGGLTIEKIEGNAQIAKVAGDVQLALVEGNLALDEVGGNLSATVEGNAKVQTALPAGQQVKVVAEGSIVCEAPQDAGGVFVLKAGGHMRVKGFGDERSARSGELRFERAPADATVTLQADGNITLRGIQLRPFDGAEFAGSIEDEMALRSVEITQEISAQIESQVGELSRQLDDKLSRLGSNEELAVSIQERVQAAMRRAEEKLAEAMRKMEQRTQESETRRRKGGWTSPPPPPPPAAPKPKRAPATDEERMMILRMVEQGKLSVEQAEKLLAALNSGKPER